MAMFWTSGQRRRAVIRVRKVKDGWSVQERIGWFRWRQRERFSNPAVAAVAAFTLAIAAEGRVARRGLPPIPRAPGRRAA